MSCNYYFEKWQKTLIELDALVILDLEYQKTKVHDKNWCDAVQRLTGMLGKYAFIYNESADCSQHNLQVQKAGYMTAIVKAVVARILELKDQIRKLVGSEYQFMGRGLIDHKITPYDIVLSDVLPKHGRDDNVQTLVLESIHKAEDRKSKSISLTDLTEHDEMLSQKINWWDDNHDSEDVKEDKKGMNVTAVYDLEKRENATTEMLVARKNATLIQAHERARKVILLLIHEKLRREKWQKELTGTLQFPARREVRERSAIIIQQFFRAYFEIKRKKLKECKRDEILGIRVCEKLFQKDEDDNLVELRNRYIEKFEKYQNQWNETYDNLKQEYIERRHDTIEDDIRDEIMHWFRKWLDEATFFCDIPKESDGGSILIVKEETETPIEWLEKYNAYLEEKRANKSKTAYEQKYDKLQARKEKLMQKRVEQSQKRKEEQILKKMMKNPKFHPGYHYPQSKRITHLIQTIEDYKTHWAYLDVLEEPNVKEKFIIDIDINNAYMEAKLEIRKSVDVAMRETFTVLSKALTEDYKRNGEEMPKKIKEKNRRKKRQREYKMDICEDIAEKLEDLAHRGYLKQYSRKKIEDFIGDPNFAGDDLRCRLQETEAFSGETRALWWERCRELSHGYHRTLLVGAKGSGKTTLVHVLASMNDAVLYEIDPAWIPEEFLSAVYLQELATSIATCARATQPSVIYIKHLHTLYFIKPPAGEDMENLNLIKRYFLRKLMKKIHKTDKIIIAASCIDPWLTRSKKMLSQFPNVVLLPNTNYSTVTIVLNEWLLKNHVIPRDLDVQSLAHVLQGYSFSHIKDTLTKFLTADRIIKIAAHGLPLHDIFDCFLQSEEVKVDYKRYLRWYTDKTHWGKKGKKLLNDQKEFQLLAEKWKKKQKKNFNSTISDASTNVGPEL